ncbi:hypothetical protein [uncultured Helcococcus sp.]|uniref:hypothetical protein n=1 Tax=uncultured Helcococcus sp. TaxID=1072508 RepID=UPI00263013E9|nr:hypothetical protein [uncultured Helcococcus sp.]
MKKSKQQKEFEKQRYELGLKYAKSTFIRYMTAVFFVIAIYWFYLSLTVSRLVTLIPTFYLILYVICSVDQYRTLHVKDEGFKKTENVMKLTLITNIILIIISLFDFRLIFGYFANAIIPISVLSIGILIKYLIIRKINKLKNYKKL